jgi:hypothetical protein
MLRFNTTTLSHVNKSCIFYSAINASFFGGYMSKLYMSYDNEGHQVALSYGHDFNESHTLLDQIDILCASGVHDLLKGFCKSFQIYNEAGDILFSSETQEAA